MDQPVIRPDQGSTPGHVARRQVFYIPGFDPFPPRRYRELYRKEAQAQAAISGYEIALGANKGAGDGFGWQVHLRAAGREVHTDIEMLTWADIVRAAMDRGVVRTYLNLIATALVYLRGGAFWRLMGLRKGPAIAALYPVVMLLGQAALASLIGWQVFAAVVWLGGGMVGRLVAVILGGAAAAGLLRAFHRWDHRLYAHYLMHDYAFTARHNGAVPPELASRLATFSARIRAALDSGTDEVLVVGHSSGAHLAVMVLADVLRGGPVGGPALGLLTLGQVVPMMSFLPGAAQLRADLRFLSVQDGLTWVDVSAPGDGCSFALCDPVAVSGAAGPGKRWPLVISAAFSQTLSAERWKALRWRFFRLHFQYLAAFDRPGDYDYFQITAGPQTLAARYRGRAPSVSRVERAASGFGPGQ